MTRSDDRSETNVFTPSAIHERLSNKAWTTSIVSYPSRGAGGDPTYRGNWGASFVEGLLATHYRGGLVVDPMEGGATTRDVCRKHDIPYVGLDLKDGFDIVRDDLLRRLGKPASLVLLHPPYHDMVRYSGNVWGRNADPRDLSHAPDYATFLELLQSALQNVHRALTPDGMYAILLADVRRNGAYLPLTADVLRIAPGIPMGSVIKAQHNCGSDATTYCGSLVRIKHEVLHIFHRAADASGFGVGVDALEQRTREAQAAWRNVARARYREVGTTFGADELHAAFDAHAGSDGTQNWRRRMRSAIPDETLRRIGIAS